MTRTSFSRRVKLTTASLMAVLFGFPGVAMANQASIRNTGPDSYNKIEFSDRSDCNVENNNHVHAINKVSQNAETGDAVVGGSGWHRYDPSAWAAQGRSYSEWESAVNAYMAQNKGNWRHNWGKHGHSGGNTIGGDATSGNASNASNNRTNISIDNSGACSLSVRGSDGGQVAKPGTKSESSKPGSVLGSNSHHTPAQGQKGEVGGSTLGGSSTSGGSGSLYGPLASGGSGGNGAHYPSKSGGSGGSGSGSGGHGGHNGSNASIHMTGPDSYNKISFTNSSHTSVNNTNNVGVFNLTTQNASSGNATVSGNTSGGSASSGGAHNSSGNNTGAGINN